MVYCLENCVVILCIMLSSASRAGKLSGMSTKYVMSITMAWRLQVHKCVSKGNHIVVLLFGFVFNVHLHPCRILCVRRATGAKQFSSWETCKFSNMQNSTRVSSSTSTNVWYRFITLHHRGVVLSKPQCPLRSTILKRLAPRLSKTWTITVVPFYC